MIVLDNQNKDLLDTVIKNELNLIEIGFTISVNLGKVFLQDSINSFCEIYLKNKYGKVIPSLSTEYRYFIIGILTNIKKEYQDYVINEILIPKFGNIDTQELLNNLETMHFKCAEIDKKVFKICTTL